MEKLYYEIPSIERIDEAIEYIKEFYQYNSEINGTGGLDRYLDNYKGWLEKLEKYYKMIPNEERVPARTYFLVRENDNKIVGMINIRLTLNENLKKFGGHIGYSIRPTERRKGYNKINLYLGLLCCQEYGIKEVLLDCDKENPGSARTIKALGGRLLNEYYEDKYVHCTVQNYSIDVDNSIKTYSEIYEPLISNKRKVLK